MANTRVLLKKSSVASRTPTTNDLEYGEVAINYTDGRLYYKDSANSIKYFLESSKLFAENSLELTNTDQVIADQFDANIYNTVKYLCQITISGEIHSTEIILMHDGSTAYTTEYGTMWSGSAELGSFTANLLSGNVRLLFTPANNDTTVKIKRISI